MRLMNETIVIENEKLSTPFQHAQAPCLKARGGRILEAYAASADPFSWGILDGVAASMVGQVLVGSESIIPAT